jgi:mannose-6-phosphate isomerase-like protein (cupin superfamily)
MKNIARLMLCGVLLACVAAGAQSSTTGEKVLSQPQVFPFDGMTMRKMPNGGESRDVIRGVLMTGEAVGVHESVLPVGSVPNPQHKIQHSEFIMVQEGMVEFEHGEKAEKVGAGGVIYVALGTMHTLKNVGDVPAKYFVVAIGGDMKK